MVLGSGQINKKVKWLMVLDRGNVGEVNEMMA
jgi:hypothetical protein